MADVALNPASHRLPFTQHHAFIIGIDAYQKVSPLQTAASDARRLAEVLGAQQHFTVHPVLLDATGGEIRALLHRTLAEQVGETDRVVFYFAGHGIAADGDDGPAGYLVPADGDPTDLASFIAMEELHQALNALPCRHLLLVLDCCFSGAFKWSSRHRAIGTLMPKRIYQERFDRFIDDSAWQVITSAAHDQKALDVVRSIGKATGERGVAVAEARVAHSPFAQALFDGLSGAADAQFDGEGDGVITATELYSYIRDQVEPRTLGMGQGLRQTPGFFPLKKHDKGEFIFLHPQHRLNLPRLPSLSPYKGLESFDEGDHMLFYGRDRAIALLREKARGCKLLVVSGASGTGKSSVVKAGLLPVLREEGCRILPVIRPGAHPLAVLEQALSQADEPRADEAGVAAARAQKAVLLIDQFEEVITRCEDAGERDRFERRLRRLLDEDTGFQHVILTVRADFEPQLGDGALKAHWARGRCTVPPFTLDELREVVVMPTLQVVLMFEPPQLVDEIVAEVVQSSGALPLLSFALSELVEAYRASGRPDRTLRKADHDRLGGVMGALRTKADAVHAGMSPGEQAMMRKIMLRMVAVEEELASRRVPMHDLVYPDAENLLVAPVVEKLVAARLVVKGENFVEPAHDAMVRAWKTLHDWIHQAGRETLILGSRLCASANEYAQAGNEGLLWNDSPHLPILEAELRNPLGWFNAREIAFIEHSARRRQALLHEREAQLQQIAEQQAARARLQRRAKRGLWTAAVLLVGLLGWVLVQTREVGRGESLVMASATQSASSRSQALRLGILATRSSWLHPANERATRALAGLVYHDALIARFGQHASAVNAAAFDRDGTHVVTASDDKTVRVWNAATGAQVGATMVHEDEVVSASFNHDGTRVLTLPRFASAAQLWDARTGQPVGVLRHEQGIRRASFSDDGTLVVTASDDTTARIWDARTGRPVGAPIAHDDDVNTASFDRQGTRVVTGAGPTVRVWDLKTRQQIGASMDHAGTVWSASFDAAGTRVLTTQLIGREARVWEAGSGTPVATIVEDDGYVVSATFSPDGTRVLTGSEYGKARLWNAQTGAQIGASMDHDHKVTAVAFSPDGTRVVTASEDYTARVWDAATGRPLWGAMAHFHPVTTAGFSPDGQRVLTASWDSTAVVWDPARIGSAELPELLARACAELDGEARKITSSDATSVGFLIPFESQGTDVCAGLALAAPGPR